MILTALAALVCGQACAAELLLQVEDFAGPWRRQTNIRGFLGAGFCTSNANPKVSPKQMVGRAKIVQPGRYYIWARGYTSPRGHRAFRLQIGEHLLRRTHVGNARRWGWELAGVVDLPAGQVQVVVQDADRGFESADAILITSDKERNPMAEAQRWLVYAGKPPKTADALRYNIEACAALAKKRTDPADAAEWAHRRSKIKAYLAAALGIDPDAPRTRLNAKVTGKTEFEHYTVENVVFESVPRFYVPANLYIPKRAKWPAPGIVVAMGHAMKEGKNYAPYQMAQIGLVRQGFVVLGFDPIGQGERMRPGMSHAMGFGSLMVGRTNEGMIVWDTIRAVDYLCSRPEVDAKRIGLTGNSGGGEATFYTMPFDARIQAGASFCFVCSYDAWIERGGDHCICNHLPGVVRHMEEFEIIGLNAPRAFLFGNGAKDPIFPIDGTRETLTRAKHLYAFAGASAMVRQVEAPLPHGWAQPLREAAYGWFAGWLQGRGDGKPLAEPKLQTLAWDAKELRCFKDGQWPQDAETIVTLNRKRAAELAAEYSTPPRTAAEWRQRSGELRGAIWSLFGGRPRDRQPRAKAMGAFEWEGCTVEKLSLATEAKLEVPALFITPKARRGKRPVLIYVDDQGKDMARTSPVVKAALARGAAVLALDLRGAGEVASPPNHLTTDTIVLGRPLLAQRVWDILQAARYLATRDDVNPKRIVCHGYGAAGLLAIFAAALDDSIAGASAQRTLASFAYAIENRLRQPLWVCVPNVLKVCDVAQAVALALPKPVVVAEPVGYGNRRLTPEQARQAMAYATRVGPLTKPGRGPAMLIGDDAAKEIAGRLLGLR